MNSLFIYQVFDCISENRYITAFIKVGGIMALHDKYMEAIPSSYDLNSTSTCGLPRQDAFHIFRDPVNSNLPWPGVIIRSTLASLWYWCTDQVGRFIIYL